jgi:gluconolactonase
MSNSTAAISRRSCLQSMTGLAAIAAPGATLIARAAEVSAGGGNPDTKQMAQFTVRASGLKGPEGPVVMADGSVLVCEMYEGRVTRVKPDGTLAPFPAMGGAANGAATGPDGACYVANNGGMGGDAGAPETRARPPVSFKGPSIQRLDLATGEFKTLYTEVDGKALPNPNDLVFDASGGFYFTAFGRTTADSMDFGGVYWARPDGSEIRKLVSRLMTPNGIAISPDQRTLYVALTEKRQVMAYEIAAPGRLAASTNPMQQGRVLASIGGNLGFDSMKVEANGNLLVATLTAGCISVFSPAGSLLEQVYLPDTGVTNLAFGGPDLRTLYVTLTQSGRLVSMRWPRPGAKLQYQAV